MNSDFGVKIPGYYSPNSSFVVPHSIIQNPGIHPPRGTIHSRFHFPCVLLDDFYQFLKHDSTNSSRFFSDFGWSKLIFRDFWVIHTISIISKRFSRGCTSWSEINCDQTKKITFKSYEITIRNHRKSVLIIQNHCKIIRNQLKPYEIIWNHEMKSQDYL